MNNRVNTTTQSAFGKHRKLQVKALKDVLQVEQRNPGQNNYEGRTDNKRFGP